MSEILKRIIPEEYNNYKCYDLLKEKFENDMEFKEVVTEGIRHNKIIGINPDFLEEIFRLNSEFKYGKTYDDYFKEGCNIGGCFTASSYFAYLLKNCYLCNGRNKFLINTKNSVNGEHYWLIDNGVIYDTTFMFIADVDYIDKLGYKDIVIKDIREDYIFLEREKRAKDESLKGVRR